jgi:hypothetical protein
MSLEIILHRIPRIKRGRKTDKSYRINTTRYVVHSTCEKYHLVIYVIRVLYLYSKVISVKRLILIMLCPV